jgi:hypothetical protein
MRTRRIPALPALLTFTALILASGCHAEGDGLPQAASSAALPRFASHAELEEAVQRPPIEDQVDEGGSGYPDAGYAGGGEGGAGGAGGAGGGGEAAGAGGAGGGGEPSPDPAGEGAAPADDTNEEVTNNQEAGVDEGGIVKNVGDHLVILRQGRVYAVQMGEPGQARLTDSAPVAATPALNEGVWYDELLVRGRHIFVIGFRYVADVDEEEGDAPPISFGATEIAAFSLDAGGRLTRRGTRYLESYDYYSSMNFASRMIAGELFLYMPAPATGWDWRAQRDRVHMPRWLEASGQRFRAGAPLFAATDVSRGRFTPHAATFHTALRCAVDDDAALECRATAVLSGWGREFYVTPEHLFLHTGDLVYAVDLATGDTRIHAAPGEAIDQFGFQQRGGALHLALVQYDEPYDWESAELNLLRLPLSDFDAEGEQALEPRTTPITPLGARFVTRQRFVDGWYLVTTDSE